MKAEYFLFNDCSEREVVKEISEVLPHIGISVLSETLIIKPIDLSNLS